MILACTYCQLRRERLTGGKWDGGEEKTLGGGLLTYLPIVINVDAPSGRRVLGRHPISTAPYVKIRREYISIYLHLPGSSLSPNGQRTQMRHLLIHDPSKLLWSHPIIRRLQVHTWMHVGIQNIFKTGGV